MQYNTDKLIIIQLLITFIDILFLLLRTSQMNNSEDFSILSNDNLASSGSRSKLLRETSQQPSQLKNTARSFCKSVKVGLPVSFGIDPTQAAFLIKELHEMRKKYAELERQVTENSRIDASMIDNITQSTRNLQIRMSQVRLQNQIDHETQKQNRQYQDLLKQKQAQIQNCNKVIETLNHATDKINQLQTQNKQLLVKNKTLERDLIEQKIQNQRISKENALLSQKIDQIENGKQLIIKGIGYQLQKLRVLKVNKEECSVVQQRFEEVLEQNYEQGKHPQFEKIKVLSTSQCQRQIGNKRQNDHSQTMEETQQVNNQQEYPKNQLKSSRSEKSSRLTNNCYRQ